MQQRQQRLVTAFPNGQRLGNGRDHLRGIAHRREGYDEHAVREGVTEFSSDLYTQARFAHAARSSKRHKPHILPREQLCDSRHLLFASDERRRLDGQVVGMSIECLEGREV